MNLLEKINAKLNDNAEEFASLFSMPRISPWIIQQFNKGYKSINDYKKIIKWVTNNNPNLNDFDFNSALKRAESFLANYSNNHYDPYMELYSNDIALKFDDGKKWLIINKEDCNAICHRLQYDCSDYLREVYNNNNMCWALQDPQDKTICIAIINDNSLKIIGQFGDKPSGCHEEIKRLCVLKGIELPIEAYNHNQLIKALANGEININNIDIRETMKRLSPIDIINCNLLNYSHYCNIETIYKLYNKTKHDCLLKYAMAYLISYGLTKTKAYRTIKIAVSNNKNIANFISSINDHSTSKWHQIMDDSLQEIQNL
jgi:hypothetical protein